MRSFLTVLGVIIGTGTMIGVGSIIAGLDGAITGVLRSFGTNTAIVFKFDRLGGRRTPEERRRKPLTYENARAIAERCPSVEHVSPYLFADSERHPPRPLQGQRRLQHPTSAAPRKRYAAGGTDDEVRPLLHAMSRTGTTCRSR